MSWRALLLLLLVAVLALLLDLSGSRRTRGGHPVASPVGMQLLPGLAGAQQDVTAITLQPSGQAAITLQREPGGWRVLPVGMSADAANVQGWLARLARTRIIAVKTRIARQYALLGLAEPGHADGATVVRFAGTRQQLPIVLVGHYDPRQGGTFVRMQGKAGALLAEGDLAPPTRAVDWAQHPLLSLPDNAVLQIDLVGPGNVRFLVDRSLDGHPRVLVAPRALRQPLDVGELMLGLFDGFDYDGVQARVSAPSDALQLRALLSDGSLLTLEAWRDAAGHALGNLSIQAPAGGLPADAAAGLEQTEGRVRAHTWRLMPAAWTLLNGALYPDAAAPQESGPGAAPAGAASVQGGAGNPPPPL